MNEYTVTIFDGKFNHLYSIEANSKVEAISKALEIHNAKNLKVGYVGARKWDF